MLGFDAINEFASFVGQLSCSHCTCLSQYYTGRYPACFGGEPPRGIPSFFFVRTVRSYNSYVLAGTLKLPSNDLPRPCLHTIKCMQVRGVDR